MKYLLLILVISVVSMGSTIKKTKESKVNINYDDMEGAVSKNELYHNHEVFFRSYGIIDYDYSLAFFRNHDSSSLNSYL